MKLKKTAVLILAFAAMIPSVAAVSTAGYSWYFKPAKDHVQPEVIPEAKGFLDEYPTIYIGDAQTKKVYLTFDAGYENGNVEKILDVLKEKNVPGAFFILPQLAKQNGDLLARMKAEGHLICNHTARHKDMSKFTDSAQFAAELTEAENLVREYAGIEMDKFYRPPEGRFSEQNLKDAADLGYTTVFWSLAYADWDNNKQLAPEKALELILARTHNGCVALLHPTSATNAAILGEYIDTLRAEGYEFGSLTELVQSDSATQPSRTENDTANAVITEERG